MTDVEHQGRGRASGRARNGCVDQVPPEAGPEDESTQDPHDVARQILLTRLTDRARSRAELAEILVKKGIPDEVASTVLDRFGDVGLIDDASFANSWVESRHRSRGLAPRALSAELRRKGVDAELISEAVAEVGDEQLRVTAEDLVRRKARTMHKLDRQAAQRRLLGMLARKGYPAGLAGSVVRDVLNQADSADDSEFGEPDW